MKRPPLFSFLLSLLLVACNSVKAEKTTLKFNEEGRFKIAQFTDLHWSDNSPNCAETEKVIKHLLATEKPHLAILTGDIVTDFPAKEGWLSIARIFEEAKTPWAVTLGNHDTEPGVTGQDVFNIIENLPYFVGEKGVEMSGCGNYVLPIQSSKDDKTAALIYCFDSHNKPTILRHSQYDWIHFDQIAWYRKTSDTQTKANKQVPLPALAFFHIPLLEFNDIIGGETMLGNHIKSVASPELNSGLFCSMVEKNDVMGVFVGHDHDNDYIGIKQGIALSYGRVSGVDAHGKLERGGRIVELHENKFRFDSWISTRNGVELMYHFPSGLSEEDERASSYLPAKEIKVKKQGVLYKYYEGIRLKSTDEIAHLTPTKTGEIENISLAPATAQDSMAFEFTTWIKIPERGVYRFYTYSDDGTKLFIDGEEVVDNDGSHGTRRVDGKIALDKGFHKLKVLYFEDYMGEFLEVGYSSRYIREVTLPDHLLYIAE